MNKISDILQIDNLLTDDFAENISPLSKFLLKRTDVVPTGADADILHSARESLWKKFSGGGNNGLEFCVAALGRLLSAKFSGKSQGLTAVVMFLEKLATAVSENRPIIFTFCSGGYKNHNSPEYPEAGWAEFFAIKYLLKYLAPIINNYKHGVVIEFENEEVSIQFNNVPQTSTDRYTESFRKLLEYFRGKTDLDLRLVITRDMYEAGPQSLYDLMEQKVPEYEKMFSELPAAEQEKWLKRAEHNFMLCGTHDYSNAARDKIIHEIKRARIMNEAYLDADYCLRSNWFEQDNRITICGTWGRMPCASPTDTMLHIKSTAHSLTDFWIGTGVLRVKDGTYAETILSKTQFKEIIARLEYIKIDSPLGEISENFKKIPVLNL